MPSDNALHKAAYNGDIKLCQALLETLNEENEDDVSNTSFLILTLFFTFALTQDAEEGNYSVHDIGASSRTPLHRCATSGYLDVCKFLVEQGANIESVDLTIFPTLL